MAYSDTELITLGREDVIQLNRNIRLRWFRLLQVRHRELVQVASDLAHLLHPDNEIRLAALIGMTGIGKTTLARRALHSMLVKVWGDYITPSDVPYIFIAAPANGEKSLSWKVFYQRTLNAANEILIDKKRETSTKDGIVRIANGAGTVAALRESVESMLKHRNVRLLV